MYRRITVPLDGTAESEHALPWAVSIARAAGASCDIELLHAAFPETLGPELYPPVAQRRGDTAEILGHVEHRLKRLADEVARAGGVSVSSAVLGHETASANDIVAELVEHIAKGPTGLVVMAAHRHGRLEQFMLGDVSESLVRHVGRPVLITRPKPGIPELALPVEIARVLIPLDGSDFSERIVPHARELAALMEARVTLLSVVAPVVTAATATVATGGGGLTQLATDIGPTNDPQRLAHAVLDRTATPLRAGGLAVDAEVVVGGRPAEAIAEYAAKHEVDVIAMTTHGRGAVARLFAGSVAEAVFRNATAALLVLRPPPLS